MSGNHPDYHSGRASARLDLTAEEVSNRPAEPWEAPPSTQKLDGRGRGVALVAWTIRALEAGATRSSAEVLCEANLI